MNYKYKHRSEYSKLWFSNPQIYVYAVQMAGIRYREKSLGPKHISIMLSESFSNLKEMRLIKKNSLLLCNLMKCLTICTIFQRRVRDNEAWLFCILLLLYVGCAKRISLVADPIHCLYSRICAWGSCTYTVHNCFSTHKLQFCSQKIIVKSQFSPKSQACFENATGSENQFFRHSVQGETSHFVFAFIFMLWRQIELNQSVTLISSKKPNCEAGWLLC